jgi:hypothetical protein
MEDIGSIPLDILPYTLTVGRATETIPYGSTDVSRAWATSTSPCDIQTISGAVVRQIYGTERSEVHRAFLPATVDIQDGDLVAATSGPYEGDHYSVIVVKRWRSHHIEADLEYSEDHTQANTLSA